MANVSASLASSSDEQAIRSVVREYGASWNRHDMAALAELFADDAHWINIVGMHWPDKSPLSLAMRRFIGRSFKRQTSNWRMSNSADCRRRCRGRRPFEGRFVHAARRRPPSEKRKSLVARAHEADWAMAYRAWPQHSHRPRRAAL